MYLTGSLSSRFPDFRARLMIRGTLFVFVTDFMAISKARGNLQGAINSLLSTWCQKETIQCLTPPIFA